MKKDSFKNIRLVDNIEKAKFVTHSGKFHLDDIISTIFLSKIFNKVTLFRAPRVTENYNDKIVYDIGLGEFDHHQKNRNGKRENGIYYSSIGLLWRKYGKEYLKEIDVDNIQYAYDIIEKELIQYIDAGDNMQNEFLIGKKIIMPNVIKLCNKMWDDDISEEEAFINALKIGDKFWDIFIKNVISRVKAFVIVSKIIEDTQECYLVLNKNLPYKDAINKSPNKKIKYVIFPSTREGYEIRCILDRVRFNNQIIKTSSIAESKIVSQNDDLIYVDNNAMLCCTNTLEGAIRLVKYNENQIITTFK